MKPKYDVDELDGIAVGDRVRLRAVARTCSTPWDSSILTVDRTRPAPGEEGFLRRLTVEDIEGDQKGFAYVDWDNGPYSGVGDHISLLWFDALKLHCAECGKGCGSDDYLCKSCRAATLPATERD